MRTKRRINACSLIQKISSSGGSSSVMIFFSFTVAALMMSMVILQYSHIYLATEHTQMLADVTADGITVGADSGWGLIYSKSSKGYQDSAVKVKEKLVSANTDRTGSDVSYLIEDDYDAKVSLKSSRKSGEKEIRQALANAVNLSSIHISNLETPNMPVSISLEKLFDIADRAIPGAPSFGCWIPSSWNPSA